MSSSVLAFKAQYEASQGLDAKHEAGKDEGDSRINDVRPEGTGQCRRE
jgi:hypothetical protein